MQFQQSLDPKHHSKKVFLLHTLNDMFSQHKPLARRDRNRRQTPKERREAAAKSKKAKKRKGPNKEVNDAVAPGTRELQLSGAAPDMDSSATESPAGYASRQMELPELQPETFLNWAHPSPAQAPFSATELEPSMGQAWQAWQAITAVTKWPHDVNSDVLLDIQDNPQSYYTYISPRTVQKLQLETRGVAPHWPCHVSPGDPPFTSYAVAFFHLSNGTALRCGVYIQPRPTGTVDFWIGSHLRNLINDALNERINMPISPPNTAPLEPRPLAEQSLLDSIASYNDLGPNQGPASRAAAHTRPQPYLSYARDMALYPQNTAHDEQDTTHYEQDMFHEGHGMDLASTAQAMASLESPSQHVPDRYAQPPQASLGTGMGSPASYMPRAFHPATSVYNGFRQPPLNSAWPPAMAQRSLDPSRRS